MLRTTQPAPGVQEQGQPCFFLFVCLTYKFKFQQLTSHMLYIFHLHLLVSLLSSSLTGYRIIIKRE